MSAVDESTSNWSTNPIALILAIASVAIYFAAISIVNSVPIADEAGHHLQVVRQFYEGDWSWPEHLPMPPTFHVAAAVICKVFGAKLHVLRLFSAVMAVAAVLLYRDVARRCVRDCSADSLLHFAWLPVLFPFSVLVYTDMASVLCVIAGVCLQLRRRGTWSAACLLVACAIRPSNVVWVGFLLAWETVRQRRAESEIGTLGAGSVIRRTLLMCWGHAVVMVLGVVFLAVMLGSRGHVVEANRPRFNIAQFYLFALFAVLLWLPVLVTRVAAALRAWAGRFRREPLRAVGLAMFFSIVVVVLTMAFENPHPWNRNPDYFRNWVLMWMDRSTIACGCFSALIVLGGVAGFRFVLCQRERRAVFLIGGFTLIYLLPHSLAEPRYYVLPAIFFNLLVSYDRADARRLTVWYGILSAGLAAACCVFGDGKGGVL